MNSRLTRVATQLTDNDKQEANALLDRLPVITKYLPEIRDLINNGGFNISSNGIINDLKTLQKIIIKILSPSFKDMPYPRKTELLEIIYNDCEQLMQSLKGQILVPNLAAQYLAPSHERDMNKLTEKVPAVMREKIKRKITNPYIKDSMTEASEKVRTRILSMIKGIETDKTKDAGLYDLESYIKILNHDYPQFIDKIKTTIADGKLHISWGQLENDIISVLKAIRKLMKDNTISSPTIQNNLKAAFDAYIPGESIALVLRNVRKSSTQEKHDINNSNENLIDRKSREDNSNNLLRGEKANEDLINFDCIIGSEPTRTELYKCKKDLENMEIIAYDDLKKQLADDKKAKNMFLSDTDRELYTTIINGIDKTRENFNKLIKIMQMAFQGFDNKTPGKQKLYFDYIEKLWKSSTGGRIIKDAIDKLKSIIPKDVYRFTFKGEIDYSNMPEHFNKKIWKDMDDKLKELIIAWNKKGIISDYGQIAPLALLCCKYYKDKTCENNITSFDNQFESFMREAKYEEALEFQKDFLLKLADKTIADIKDIQIKVGMLFGKFEGLIRDIDIDEEDPLTWLNNFKNMLNNGIIGSTNNGKATICTAENFYAAIFNATLRSLNLGVYKRIDKTAEDFLRKAKNMMKQKQLNDASDADFNFKYKHKTDSPSSIVDPNQSVWTNKRRQTITPIVEKNNMASITRRLLKKIV